MIASYQLTSSMNATRPGRRIAHVQKCKSLTAIKSAWNIDCVGAATVGRRASRADRTRAIVQMQRGVLADADPRPVGSSSRR